MKAVIDGVEIEGTPDEILTLIQSLRISSVKASGTANPSVNSIDASDFVDADMAFRVLKRRPLSNEQKLLLSELKANHPSWTTAHTLRKKLKFEPSQLAGLLGAFGKRFTATEGYKEGKLLFDQEWDYDADCNRYRLPEGLLAAVKRAGL